MHSCFEVEKHGFIFAIGGVKHAGIHNKTDSYRRSKAGVHDQRDM